MSGSPCKELEDMQKSVLGAQDLQERLTQELTSLIAETNGLPLMPTLEIFQNSRRLKGHPDLQQLIGAFRQKLILCQRGVGDIQSLADHPVGQSLYRFFKAFPLPFREEHTHLTGALQASFLYPLLKKRLDGPEGPLCLEKLRAVYGDEADQLKTVDDVERMLTLRDSERFERYLQVLYLPKLVLIDREAHRAAAYHMARTMMEQHNVGFIRIKFTYSRLTTDPKEQIPGAENLTNEESLLGLFEGFRAFQKEVPQFQFALSPCFRKEPGFYDQRFATKKLHFQAQVDEIIDILDRYPELVPYLQEVDTVGDERSLYRKEHFAEMQQGLRKLASRGFSIRSHHGETFNTLKRGIQAVDNAMNIWRIDTLEHGLALGINPNSYYHIMLEQALDLNDQKQSVLSQSTLGRELEDMQWAEHRGVLDKLYQGVPLSSQEINRFVKVKFHHAREVEHYQHDVLNRVLDKSMTVTALPTSNQKLTTVVPGFKDHPFSWWEKKGVDLGVGTDNYVTLGTNYIRELVLLALAEPEDLKITKLLMVATGENRRPYLSHLLWEMRKNLAE
jgi:adenosine deaminase